MKLYNLIISSLALASVMLTSCDDFLTEMPKHQLTVDNAIRDYKSAKNIINGMYAVYEYSGTLGGDIPSNVYAQAGLWDYKRTHFSMSYSQTNDDTSRIWTDLYSCINAANAAIGSLEVAPENIFPSTEAKDKLIAEARCFRGFMNLNLLWYFGRWFDDADSPYGIIYRDEVSNLSNLMLDRSTVGESYQYIIDDLVYAEEHLDDHTTSVYMSKQFAQAMHAKLLTVRGWEGDYAKALELVNAVLTNPGKAAIEPNITELYDKAWESSELLFAQHKIDIIAEASSWNTAGNSDYIWGASLYGAEFEDIPTAWLKKDPRYDYIFGMALGAERWQVDQGVEKLSLKKLYHEGRIVEPNARYCTYVLRLTELYILKAELLARTNPGDLAGALAPINEYRSKYTTPELPAFNVPETHEALMDLIFKEYVVALFLENESAWFASIRFETEGDTWLKKLRGDEVSYSENQYCWPIPNNEIIAHTNPIAQNPGLE